MSNNSAGAAAGGGAPHGPGIPGEPAHRERTLASQARLNALRGAGQPPVGQSFRGSMVDVLAGRSTCSQVAQGDEPVSGCTSVGNDPG